MVLVTNKFSVAWWNQELETEEIHVRDARRHGEMQIGPSLCHVCHAFWGSTLCRACWLNVQYTTRILSRNSTCCELLFITETQECLKIWWHECACTLHTLKGHPSSWRRLPLRRGRSSWMVRVREWIQVCAASWNRGSTWWWQGGFAGVA